MTVKSETISLSAAGLELLLLDQSIRENLTTLARLKRERKALDQRIMSLEMMNKRDVIRVEQIKEGIDPHCYDF